VKIFTISFVYLFFATQCFAAKYSTNFSTTRDLASTANVPNLTSSFKIKNSGSSSAVVYGLYIRQFSYVAAGQSCDSAIPMYSSSQNTTAGAMVMPVTIPAHSEAVVGANYLYNMIYTANYYVRILIASSPPGCALPGCTWGSDTTIYNWCIYVGAMAPVSVSAGYTAKVVPSTTAVSGAGFNYDLISNYNYIGPISCDDQNMTCSVASSQTQSF
jgi:hypothetical protein